jgi:hypothetical protein
VNHVNTTIIHNTYNTTVTNITVNHISYNGGVGGVAARARPEEESYANERHVGPIPAQMQHVQAARTNPELRASANHGMPSVAATAKPGDFRTGVVPARQAGGEYRPPPAAAARGNETRPNTNEHASELQPHQFTPANTGNAATDGKYQQQQEKLAAKQAQDHQKLQQQQENEHQQAAKKNYNDAQKAQMEQRHAQQTQKVEQKHATQQKQMEQRQPAPRPESRPPAERPR